MKRHLTCLLALLGMNSLAQADYGGISCEASSYPQLESKGFKVGEVLSINLDQPYIGDDHYDLAQKLLSIQASEKSIPSVYFLDDQVAVNFGKSDKNVETLEIVGQSKVGRLVLTATAEPLQEEEEFPVFSGTATLETESPYNSNFTDIQVECQL